MSRKRLVMTCLVPSPHKTAMFMTSLQNSSLSTKSRKRLAHGVFTIVATQDGHIYDICKFPLYHIRAEKDWVMTCLILSPHMMAICTTSLQICSLLMKSRKGSAHDMLNTFLTHDGHVYDITVNFLFTNGQQKKIGS